MEKRIDKIQQAIFTAFIAVYALALIINAIKAVAGIEHLAVHHWPLFAGAAALWWVSLEQEQKNRITSLIREVKQARKTIVKKAARTTLCGVRAACSLPALFIKSYNEIKNSTEMTATK